MTCGSYTPALEKVMIMSYTIEYMQNSMVFAYVESTEHITPMSRLFQPFQYHLWISIGILLTISTIIILLLKKLPDRQRHFIIGGHVNRTPILNMWNILIGNAHPNPRLTQIQYFGVFARTLCLLWILFWLVVRSSYEGSLYEFLQSQRVKSPFDSVEKVRQSNVKLYIINSVVPLIPPAYDKER